MNALGLGIMMPWVAVIPTHALTTILILEIHKLGLYLLVMCQQVKIVRLEIRLVATLPTHALVLSIIYGVQILVPWVAVKLTPVPKTGGFLLAAWQQQQPKTAHKLHSDHA